MIDIRALENIAFGEKIDVEDVDSNCYLRGIQKYFGVDNVGLLPREDLEKGYKNELANMYAVDDFEKKHNLLFAKDRLGIDHLVAISSNKALIETLNKSTYAVPKDFFNLSVPLALEQEKYVFGTPNSLKAQLEPVEVGSSYVFRGPKPTDKFHGLTIVDPHQLNKILEFYS